MRKRSFVLVAGACVASLSLTAGVALADPVPPLPPDRPLAGVGSDTTQDVMNGFANGTTASVPPFAGIKNGANFVVSSFDAIGSPTITTHPGIPACVNIPRPSGSGNGLNAMNADTNGCIQFARVSSGTLAATNPNATFIPFATDGLPFATATITNVPKSFTVAQLTTIYSRNVAQGCIRQPLLPKPGSGTRSAWLTFIGVGGAGQPALGNCVTDTLNGVPIEEHDGRVVTNAEQLVPFSVAQWVTQTTQPAVTDRHGPTVLRSVNGIGPFDNSFPFVRTVYNAVRTAQLGNADINATFVGAGSAVCTHPEVTKVFGFTPITTGCGSTTLVN